MGVGHRFSFPVLIFHFFMIYFPAVTFLRYSPSPPQFIYVSTTHSSTLGISGRWERKDLSLMDYTPRVQLTPKTNKKNSPFHSTGLRGRPIFQEETLLKKKKKKKKKTVTSSLAPIQVHRGKFLAIWEREREREREREIPVSQQS